MSGGELQVLADDLAHHFAQVFSQHAGFTAMGCGAEVLSYQDLASRTATIAAQLTRGGVTPGSRIGLHLQRGPDLIAAILACLHNGLCFVPLDPEFPPQRLQDIAQDADLTLVLQDTHGEGRFAMPSLYLQTAEADEAARLSWPAFAGRSPAYMMFTSGSTGRPKGVVISRHALANFLFAASSRLGLSAATRWLFITTPAFDISLLEMLGPLWAGGALEVVGSPAHKDPDALLAVLAEHHEINTLQATPAFWRMLLKTGWQGRAGLIALCGGEALDATLAENLAPRVSQLWNCYGPTEATVWSMMAPVHLPIGAEGILLSHSLEGYRHWVLADSGAELVAADEGELCIEGPSLANGYWARDDLSAQSFIGWQGRQLYRTGDRVQRIGEDAYRYLGRLDEQVKLRGFRIELGEIEACLRAIDGVQDAAVKLQGIADEAYLVAYIELGKGVCIGRMTIRRVLQQRLPHYMIPSRILLLDSMPKTASGKLDRKSLVVQD
ncbi:amino acid adenylation domain-containing protein [Pseudomonas segetis]